MLPPQAQMMLRPRYFAWILFVLLFVWTSIKYKNHKEHRPVRRIKRDLGGLMVGDIRVGNEWVDIPDGVNLPPGLDIEVDMQTGKKRVKLHVDSPRATAGPVVPVGPVMDAEAEYSPMPQRKWERIYEAKHKTFIDGKLEDLESSDDAVVTSALEYLDEHCGTIDVGAGLVRSQAFPALFKVLSDTERPDRRLAAAEIIFHCVQNNPVAVEGVLTTDLIEVLVGRIQKEVETHKTAKTEDEQLKVRVITKRILSSLTAIVRGDKSLKALIDLAKAQAVTVLSHATTALIHDGQVVDRILVLLVEVVMSHGGGYAEAPAAVNLMENILKNLKKPYSDWMSHAYRQFCHGRLDQVQTKPALLQFCQELNANPADSSMLQ